MLTGIIAIDEDFGIGMNDGTIPWKIKEDMEHFRETTIGETVLMGRKTWDSIPAKFRPLPMRNNIILTRDLAKFVGDGNLSVESSDYWTQAVDGPETVLDYYTSPDEEVYVMGGKQIYELFAPHIDKWIVTLVKGSFNCEVSMSRILFQDFCPVGFKHLTDGATVVELYKSDYVENIDLDG